MVLFVCRFYKHWIAGMLRAEVMEIFAEVLETNNLLITAVVLGSKHLPHGPPRKNSMAGGGLGEPQAHV